MTEIIIDRESLEPLLVAFKSAQNTNLLPQFRAAFDAVLRNKQASPDTPSDSASNEPIDQICGSILDQLFTLMSQHPEISTLLDVYVELFRFSTSVCIAERKEGSEALQQDIHIPNEQYDQVLGKYLLVIQAYIDQGFRLEHLCNAVGINRSTVQRQLDPEQTNRPHKSTMEKFIRRWKLSLDDFLSMDVEAVVSLIQKHIAAIQQQ